MPALPVHHTETSDAAWDGPAAVKAIDKDTSVAQWRWEFAWEDSGEVDSDADASDKEDFKFPHHFVTDEGSIGAASTKACSSGIGVLNGGMGGADIPDADRQGVYDHLVAHLKDAGETDIPELEPRALTVTEARERSESRAQERSTQLRDAGVRVWGEDDAARGHKARQRRSLAPVREVRFAPTVATPAASPAPVAYRATDLPTDNGEDNLVEITGFVIRYGVPYEVWDPWGSFTETIHYGAATAVLADVDTLDCRQLTQHDAATVLARTTSPTTTLTLTETIDGVAVRALIDPRISDASDLILRLQHKLITQMSVGMVVDERADVWSGEDDWGLPDTRDIYGLIEIPDVSAVTYPASPTTSIGLGAGASVAMARSRKLWEVAREGRAGRISQHDSEMLMRALERLQEVPGEVRARFVDPRSAASDAAYDHVVTAAIQQAHTALSAAVQAQAGDDDNDTDPADAAVWEHLTAALNCLNQAMAAQATDQDAADQDAAAEDDDREIDASQTDGDDTGSDDEDDGLNDDGTRAAHTDHDVTRRQVDIDLESLRLARR